MFTSFLTSMKSPQALAGALELLCLRLLPALGHLLNMHSPQKSSDVHPTGALLFVG